MSSYHVFTDALQQSQRDIDDAVDFIYQQLERKAGSTMSFDEQQTTDHLQSAIAQLLLLEPNLVRVGSLTNTGILYSVEIDGEYELRTRTYRETLGRTTIGDITWTGWFASYVSPRIPVLFKTQQSFDVDILSIAADGDTDDSSGSTDDSNDWRVLLRSKSSYRRIRHAISILQADIQLTNEAIAWYDEPRSKGDMIALMHSEVSELLEWTRRPDFIEDEKHGFLKPNDVSDHINATGEAEELADIIIRVLDYAIRFDEDVASALIAKLDYNSRRGHRHGGKLS